jgi:UDPglucose 6-dehydrogenase
MDNISVIGIGKLGLCFCLSLERAGYRVVGVDVNEAYVKSINEKTLNSPEARVNDRLAGSKNFEATTDLDKALAHSNILFVVVATPSLLNGRYDHSQIEGLVEDLKLRGAQNETKHLVMNCTTMPGYCEELGKRLEDHNWTVTYNPEFIAQGTIIRDQENPDMILIGEANPMVGNLLEEVYERMTDNDPRVCRMSPTEAEITKISLNCFLTTKIAYTNMIGDIVKKSGGTPQVVLDAIGADTRVGKKLTRYGFGYGGPCFPRDNRALGIFASDINVSADISFATDEMNKKHLQFQLDDYMKNNPKTAAGGIAFGKHDKSDYSDKISVWFESVTYKEGSTMIEESQQLEFAVGLAYGGYEVLISDVQEVIETVQALYGDLLLYEVRKN